MPIWGSRYCTCLNKESKMTKSSNITAPTWSTSFLDNYLPSTLGFDRVFETLDHAQNIINSGNLSFPPVNVIRVDEYNYTIELAIAGYADDEVEISSADNLLTITGKKAEKDDRKYLVKGIAGRSFQRSFLLADTIVVRDASLKDGILSVRIENVIPEERKPRKIEITKVTKE